MKKMFRSKWSMITYILSFCFLFVGTSLVFASLPIKAYDDDWEEYWYEYEVYIEGTCVISEGEHIEDFSPYFSGMEAYALSNFSDGTYYWDFLGYEDQYGNWWYNYDMSLVDPVTNAGTYYLTEMWEKYPCYMLRLLDDGEEFASYDCNTYDGIPTNVLVPTKDGYTFLGWYDSYGTQYYDNNGDICEAWGYSYSLDLYTEWEEDYYEDIYKLELYVDNEHRWSYDIGSDSGLPGFVEVPEKVGAMFIGWFDDCDANGNGYGTQYYDHNGRYDAPEDWFEDLALYAGWETELELSFVNSDGETQSHMVTYNLADGWPTTLDESMMPYVADYQVFLGWYDESLTTKYYGADRTIVSGVSQNEGSLYANIISNLWTDYAVAPSGSGTSSNPYIIDSAQKLAWIAKETNGGNAFSGKYFSQTADIDLESIYLEEYDVTINPYWVPIGTQQNVFKGQKFAGNTYSIKNMETIETNYVGLFGKSASSYLVDIKIVSATIGLEKTTGSIYVGAVAGYTENGCVGYVDKTNITINSKGDGDVYVGGIVGNLTAGGMSGTFRDGSIDVKVDQKNSALYVGGLAGQATWCQFGFFENSTVEVEASIRYSSTYSVNKNMYIGGIAGCFIEPGNFVANRCEVSSSSITVNSFLTVLNKTLSSQINSNLYVGGITGYYYCSNNGYGDIITNSIVNDTDITAKNTLTLTDTTCNGGSRNLCVGGIIGYSAFNKMEIKNSTYSAGKISANYQGDWKNFDDNSNSSSYISVGGIAGMYANINNCVVDNEVLITATTDNCPEGIFLVGGILGYNGDVLYSQINDVSITATDVDYLGGIAGYSSSVVNCVVNKCTMDVDYASRTTTAYAGGLCGFWIGADVIGNIVKNSSISARVAGGLAGRANSSISKNIVDNCVVKNAGTLTGGFVGESNGATISDCLYVVGDNSTQQLVASGSAILQDIVVRIETTSKLDTETVITKLINNSTTVKCLAVENAQGNNLYYTGSGDWPTSTIKIVNGRLVPACFWIAAGAEDVTDNRLKELGYKSHTAS